MAVAIVIAKWAVNALRDLDPFEGRYFVQSEWLSQAGSYDPKNSRARMVGDLRRNHLRRQMHQSAVQTLLGTPDLTTPNNEWEYLLGMWSGFGMDYDTLTIAFDHKDQVSSIHVVQH